MTKMDLRAAYRHVYMLLALIHYVVRSHNGEELDADTQATVEYLLQRINELLRNK